MSPGLLDRIRHLVLHGEGIDADEARELLAERDAYREACDALLAEAPRGARAAGDSRVRRTDRAMQAVRALGWRPEGER
jgi:hypothetical protein